jgi:predicted dehydrogenase
MPSAFSMVGSVHKLLRFMFIYGPRRSFFKVAGRTRLGRAWMLGIWPWPRNRNIGVIGCGQFAFATIGYVIATRLGNRFASSYDQDARAAATFARFYGCTPMRTAADLIADPLVQTVYVASTHSTHAEYAIAALRAGKSVYVEKPVAVSRQQLCALLEAEQSSRRRLFAGYNRPFSAAIQELKTYCTGVEGPLTLCCVIVGHMIPTGHWYRDPGEGTRICGNVGHWLDLMVHIMSWRWLPCDWRIVCEWSDPSVRDDNLAITLSSNEGDLVNIVITSRSDPYEGVTEMIVLQWGAVLATIDDFRRMTLRKGSWVVQRRYWPKDVGHAAAIMQPFGGLERALQEVEASTLLMLSIAEMVREGRRSRDFSFANQSGAAGQHALLSTS